MPTTAPLQFVLLTVTVILLGPYDGAAPSVQRTDAVHLQSMAAFNSASGDDGESALSPETAQLRVLQRRIEELQQSEPKQDVHGYLTVRSKLLSRMKTVVDSQLALQEKGKGPSIRLLKLRRSASDLDDSVAGPRTPTVMRTGQQNPVGRNHGSGILLCAPEEAIEFERETVEAAQLEQQDAFENELYVPDRVLEKPLVADAGWFEAERAWLDFRATASRGSLAELLAQQNGAVLKDMDRINEIFNFGGDAPWGCRRWGCCARRT